MGDHDVVVSVRFSVDSLRKLQLIARVYSKSVGELIRTAIDKHVEELVHTDEFKDKATEMQERSNKALVELLKHRLD